MRKYHLVLADGSEQDITADNVEIIRSGALTFFNRNGEVVKAFAPMAWYAVEVEARDDR